MIDKKLTPLGELIAELEKYITDEDSHTDKMFRLGIRDAISKAKSLLEKEKQMVVDAVTFGQYNTSLSATSNKLTVENYFNETYKQII